MDQLSGDSYPLMATFCPSSTSRVIKGVEGNGKAPEVLGKANCWDSVPLTRHDDFGADPAITCFCEEVGYDHNHLVSESSAYPRSAKRCKLTTEREFVRHVPTVVIRTGTAFDRKRIEVILSPNPSVFLRGSTINK